MLRIMAMGKVLMVLSMLVSVTIISVHTQKTNHVVGGDRGWDPNSDIVSWSSSLVFRVGDKIWFTYSAGHENVVELKTIEEYEACDVTNPIRMFTDGLDVLPLEEEGIRYFTSGKPESCKNGLKLHVDVQSQDKPDYQNTATPNGATIVLADGPTTPSASLQLNGLSIGVFVGFIVSYFAL